jgi:hypothetical protein
MERNNFFMSPAFETVAGHRDAGLRRKMQPDRELRAASVDAFPPKGRRRTSDCASLFPMGNIWSPDP